MAWQQPVYANDCKATPAFCGERLIWLFGCLSSMLHINFSLATLLKGSLADNGSLREVYIKKFIDILLNMQIKEPILTEL